MRVFILYILHATSHSFSLTNILLFHIWCQDLDAFYRSCIIYCSETETSTMSKMDYCHHTEFATANCDYKNSCALQNKKFIQSKDQWFVCETNSTFFCFCIYRVVDLILCFTFPWFVLQLHHLMGKKLDSSIYVPIIYSIWSGIYILFLFI